MGRRANLPPCDCGDGDQGESFLDHEPGCKKGDALQAVAEREVPVDG